LPCGGILSFDRGDAADAYEARAGRFGLAVERLDRAAVLARWPGLGRLPIVAALHIPSDGVIDVAALLRELGRGVPIVCDAEVERVEPAGRGVRLATRRGAIAARLVVDAAGAWAGALLGEPPLAAFKRHVHVLEGAAPAGQPFVWHLGADELYVRADASGLLVSPCDATRVPAGDQQADDHGDELLRARFAATAWAGTPITRRWACQRAFTPSGAMRLGRDPARPWLVWAAGLGGHGATAAAGVGEVVAEACVAALA